MRVFGLVCMLGGAAALAWWAVNLSSGAIPVTGTAQRVLVGLILAFPVASLVTGAWMVVRPRKRRA